MKILLLFFPFFFLAPLIQADSTKSLPIDLFNKVDLKKISQSRAWKKLLHFEKNTWGDFEGQVDSPGFYLSIYGKQNAEEELLETLRQFWLTAEQPEEKSTTCKFPARYFFLKSSLKDLSIPWPTVSCPRFEKYFQALKGQSVSLIFSSFFLNNPSSSFGHTLLRINKSPESNGQRFELLDYGINFAANSDHSMALFYAFKGLFGFFPGTFTSLPYYYKVREYNNAESRDLWEYELALPANTADRLIEHIWELGPAWLDYWYLTENCSYFMITLLEAADPELYLSEKLKKWVIPSDTVQVIFQQPGLVKKVTYRPSIRTEFYSRLKPLSENEVHIIKQILSRKKIPKEMDALAVERQALVYDTAIDAVDYKFIHDIQHEGAEKSLKDDLLLKRSQNPQISQSLKISVPEIEAPHLSHGSRKMHFGLDSKKIYFRYKFALHELIDPIAGYPEYAQISFFDSEFSLQKSDSKIDIKKFTLFEVLSLTPWDQLFKPTSWRLKVGFEQIDTLNFPKTHVFQISGGPGLTYQWNEDPKISSYLGLKSEFNFPSWTSETRPQFNYGLNLILRFRHTADWVTLLEAFPRFESQGAHRYSPELSAATQRSISSNKSVQLKLISNPTETEGRLDYVVFY